MNICVYGASSNLIRGEYIAAGEKLGYALAEKRHSLIFGGGAGGMMGAVARGAFSCGGAIIGIVPEFFNVDGVIFDGCTELIFTDTMRTRKQKMENMADAFVMLPGGIGTFDEFFEILTLKQLGRHGKPVAVLNTEGYFDELLKMLEKAVKENFMLDRCMELFSLSESPEEIICELERQQNKAVEIYKNI